jgi:hypothetical protein
LFYLVTLNYIGALFMMQIRHTKCGNPLSSFVYKFEYYNNILHYLEKKKRKVRKRESNT